MTEMNKEERDPLTEVIIACCFQVHNEIGPGFPERIYHNALMVLFKEKNMKYETEKEYSVLFNGKNVGKFRCDLVVKDKVIIELKALSGKIPVLFEHQLLSYLNASEINVGLIVNFGNKSCEVRRLIYPPNYHRNLQKSL